MKLFPEARRVHPRLERNQRGPGCTNEATCSQSTPPHPCATKAPSFTPVPRRPGQRPESAVVLVPCGDHSIPGSAATSSRNEPHSYPHRARWHRRIDAHVSLLPEWHRVTHRLSRADRGERLPDTPLRDVFRYLPRSSGIVGVFGIVLIHADRSSRSTKLARPSTADR